MARDFYRAGNVALESRYIDLENEKTSQPRILLVDDDPVIGETLKAVLEMHQFQVIGAGNVADALHLIDTQGFDVLLSDLHMPGAADGLAVMSAMRHKHPDAITLLFTGYLAVNEAMDAILLQADEILVKPMPIDEMVALIRDRLAKRVERRRTNNGRVASILECDILPTVANRLFAVKTDDELPRIRLSGE
jgi:DNA-binding NtrC family response regulator